MQHSYPAQLARPFHATLSVAALTVAAGLLTSATASAQLVTAEVVALAGPSENIAAIWDISSDGADSWVASASEPPFTTLSTQIYGVLGGSGTTAPGVLRVPQTIGGYPQAMLRFPRVLGDNIAYSSSTSLGTSTPDSSSWINDQLVAESGQVIGSTGRQWLACRTPILTTGTDFFVPGFASSPNATGPASTVIVRFPATSIELGVGITIPGLSGPVQSIFGFDVSRSGDHWVALVGFDSAQTGQVELALLLDGELYVFPSGLRVTTEDGFWSSFWSAKVSDSAGVVFHATAPSGTFIFRAFGDRVATPLDRQLVDISPSGLALTVSSTAPGIGAHLDGLSLDRLGVGGVDADGNGAVDAGWSLARSLLFNPTAALLGDGRVLVATAIEGPGVSNGTGTAVSIASLALPEQIVCEGAVNGSGTGASIRAIGSDIAAFNDLDLRVSSLNGTTVLLPLYSRTPDFVANPAGSEGNLCLGGAIGRGAPIVGSPFVLYDVSLTVYPQWLPQPNGAVAAQPGETWYFQCWYRQAALGAATSNFTSAVGVTFR